MPLAVFLPRRASQVHLDGTMPEPIELGKRVSLTTTSHRKALVAAGAYAQNPLQTLKNPPQLRKPG
jgi:hypothetical protein